MKAIAAALLLVLCGHADATRYTRLESSWFEKGDQMCRYDNGMVLNVGGQSCPTRIAI